MVHIQHTHLGHYRGCGAQRGARRRQRGQGAVAALALLVVVAVASPAGADEPGETTQGYLLVQQALGHLAHDTSPDGMDLAMEKIDDAIATPDKEGVDVATLQRAKTALEADQVELARTDLQASIAQALGALPPATGEDTGTTVILPALDTRGSMSASDWLFVAISVLAMVSGLVLAYRFRPPDSMEELRLRVGAKQ